MIEVVGGEGGPFEIEAEPDDIALHRLDELLAFAQRIGVVEAQVGLAAELLGDAEVETDGLGMPDVQKAVRLRREPRNHVLDRVVAQVGANAVADEIPEILGHRRSGSCTQAGHCTGTYQPRFGLADWAD